MPGAVPGGGVEEAGVDAGCSTGAVSVDGATSVRRGMGPGAWGPLTRVDGARAIAGIRRGGRARRTERDVAAVTEPVNARVGREGLRRCPDTTAGAAEA
jgi:hypothetical protein